VRYVDDLLLLADDKMALHDWRAAVIEHLRGLRLTIHENSAQLRPCRSGAPFLGWQVYPDHRRLKRRNVVQARRRLRTLSRDYRLGRVGLDQAGASLQSWLSHARHGDTWGLRTALLHDFKLTRESDGPAFEKHHVADLRQDL
jgi:hypothetical protein